MSEYSNLKERIESASKERKYSMDELDSKMELLHSNIETSKQSLISALQ